ncbi:MAG: PVC-type heme-binding CxxCH protein [Planctomycetota bacterium]
MRKRLISPAFVIMAVAAIGLGLLEVEPIATSTGRLLAQTVPANAVKAVKIPDVWKNAPGSGVFWYRAWVELPAAASGQAGELFVEAADDARELFVNGEKVGSQGGFPPQYRSGLGDPEKFTVPARLLRPGRPNVIAIRIYQEADRRTGFNVAAPALFVGNEAARLAGLWQTLAGDREGWAAGTDTADPPADSRFARWEPAADISRTLKKLADEAGPLTPAESLRRFQTPADLAVELVLSEPDIGQPLQLSWDTRGRLWVVEFRQYPNPAGLKMVSRDKFLRAVYDRVPPPPPRHFRGEDRITIHEDSNGDGVFDRHKTFVEGLSLVSSCAVGLGGVWVLNPPYLLFYPDRNGDDVPDGDPEVHLEGFWLEDSHSIANSLTWGPDGWLYGGQGSTVSGDVKRPGSKDAPVRSMGQLIWRYHPERRLYEIFAEGGGNTFGVEIDAKGRIYSGHNGGDTRGFHYVQGGYFQKGFGKHGALSNPYSFGYFPQMAHHSVPRFTHTFVIYEESALPAAYRGKLFGVEPLQGRVVFSDFQPDRSSFKTRDLGHALTTTDSWFRPVDIKAGPDGGLYVADLYEQRIDHASHYQGRIDKGSGRVYRIKAKDGRSGAKVELGVKPTGAVPTPATPATPAIPATPATPAAAATAFAPALAALRSDDRWQRQAAQRVLADAVANRAAGKGAAALAELLRGELSKSTGQTALETLWALHRAGGLDESTALRALDHDDPYVRLWTARLLGDQNAVTPALRDKLAELAYRDPHVAVRSQLAATARRLPAADALAIVRQALTRSEDLDDIHVPLLLWWAIESHAEPARDAVLAMFADPALWRQPLTRKHITQRLMRRYAATGARKDLLTCARLLELAPDDESRKALMAGFEEAYQGRSLAGLPNELAAAIAKSGGASLPLRLRQGEDAALQDALKLLADPKADNKSRRQLVEVLGQVVRPAALPTLLELVDKAGDEPLRMATLTALQAYDDPRVAGKLVETFARWQRDTQAAAVSVLAARKTWTLALLDAVADGRVPRESLAAADVKKLVLRPDAQIADRVRALFGEVQGATTGEMRAQVERLHDAILAGSGNPYNGKQLYIASCGKCHRLFEDGGRIGPELTSYKRDDLRRMLLNVVNPSAEIREGFENYVAITGDGRTLNGFISDQDAQVVTLRGPDGQTTVLPRADLEDLKAVPVSLMPEGLLKDLSDQQIRDLFAYLRSTQPLP